MELLVLVKNLIIASLFFYALDKAFLSLVGLIMDGMPDASFDNRFLWDDY